MDDLSIKKAGDPNCFKRKADDRTKSTAPLVDPLLHVLHIRALLVLAKKINSYFLILLNQLNFKKSTYVQLFTKCQIFLIF